MYKHLLLLSLAWVQFHSSFGQSSPSAVDTSLIAFSSDTQAPMWIESLWLKKTNNRYATKKLFHDIEQRKPGSLFLMGDVVNLGSSDRQWKPMDEKIQRLRRQGTNVYAVLGNHEVMGRAKKGERKFQSRFPEHVPTGYVEIKDSVAIVLLNSNFKKLSKADDELQVKWYQEKLELLDHDPSIVFIISGCHHSPYTNSKIVKPSTDVRQKFLPFFMNSPKSRLFVSGHCHGFEHYNMQGKDFLVIGGGGGLHQPLNEGKDKLPDLAEDYKPLFHYITVKRNGHQLSVTSYKITQDFNGFEEGLSMTISPLKQFDIAARTAPED